MSLGILVGTDDQQEYLLAWWWSHFSKWNTYPVAFADFGMSPEAQSWCKERGTLISVPKAPIVEPPLLDEKTVLLWENRWKERGIQGDLWKLRKVWFQKPLALSLSPFKRTLWLDLDCEVRKNLHPLLETPLGPTKLAAMTSETHLSAKVMSSGKLEHRKILHYNSGVILLEKDSFLLDLWIKSLEQGSLFAQTEEELLSFLISDFPATLLSPLYNWKVLERGPNDDAFIYHWMGEEGKKAIECLSHFGSDI